jgi:hypothetical protein
MLNISFHLAEIFFVSLYMLTTIIDQTPPNDAIRVDHVATRFSEKVAWRRLGPLENFARKSSSLPLLAMLVKP